MKERAPERKRILSRQAPLPERMGSYQILSRLAEGGMGTVYFARHTKLGGMAAIKVLKSERRDSAAVVARFQKEAQALARVEHPNVVQVQDVGEQDGHIFIAMELAAGMDLRQWLKRDGRLKGTNLAYVTRQIISAIAAAHEKGVLHRDIKPDNVIVDQYGAVKISDFGLADDARLVAEGTERQTFATIAYAAPEVLSGQRSDARSDVFSLAATLWHVATGELPFGKASRVAVLAKQKEPLPDLRELAPSISPSLAKAITQGLRPKAEERPADALAFQDLAYPSGNLALEWQSVVAAASFLIMAALIFYTWATMPEDVPKAQESEPIAQKTVFEEDDQGEREEILLHPPALERHRGIKVASTREARAKAEWEALALPLEDLRDDTPATLEILYTFISRHHGTLAAEKAESTFEGLAAPFQRERKAAFQKLQTQLAGASDARSAELLMSFPESYQKPIAGLAGDFGKEISKLIGDWKAKVLLEAESAIMRAQSAYRAKELFEAINILEGADFSLVENESLLKRRKSLLASWRKERARLRLANLAKDDAYIAELRAARIKALDALDSLLAKDLLSAWRAGPTLGDAKVWKDLQSQAGPILAAIEGPLAQDQQDLTKAYAWLSTALKDNKGILVEVPSDSDQTPSLGLALDAPRLEVRWANSTEVFFRTSQAAEDTRAPLRSLGIRTWIRLAEESDTFQAEYLGVRMAQIADQSRREAWQREARRHELFVTYTPLSRTQSVLQELRMIHKGDPESSHRGYLEFAHPEIDSYLDVGLAIADAAGAMVDASELLRVWKMAPESLRILRALAKMDAAGDIPPEQLAGVRKGLEQAANKWQDEVLWRWTQSQKKASEANGDD